MFVGHVFQVNMDFLLLKSTFKITFSLIPNTDVMLMKISVFTLKKLLNLEVHIYVNI